jgi:CelD/BcsL family acetyltransferase involved in cellulose biosynthesis
MLQATELLRPAPAVTKPIQVEWVDTLWGLKALRPEWHDLLRSSASNNPFLTWEWLEPWWKHVGGATSLRVIAVRSGQQLIAIAPLFESQSRLGWFSRLELLGTGYAGSDYLDVIVRRGCELDAMHGVTRLLRSQERTVRFDHLPEGSCGAQIANQMTSCGWIASVRPAGVCPVIRLAGHNWDSFLATLGSAHRANVRRRLRGLEQQFDTRFEQVTSEPARRDALAALTRFHASRFEADGGSTAFLTPALHAFHDEATRRALERGWLRMYTLQLNGRIAAVMYGFLYGGQFYFYQHGFSQEYARHSVGLALMALTLRAAIDESAHTFDLLWGTEPYKWLWAKETRALSRIDLFSPNLAGRMHRRAAAARNQLKTFAYRFRTPGDSRAS